MTKKGESGLIPWPVIQHEMAVQLATLFADHPEEVPPDLHDQQLDAASIEAWPDVDAVTIYFHAYRRHGDRLGFDWPLIYSEHAAAIEAFRIALEAEYGKYPRSAQATKATPSRA